MLRKLYWAARREILRFLIKIGALFETKIPGRTPGKISNFGRGRGRPGVAILAGAGAGDPVES